GRSPCRTRPHLKREKSRSARCPCSVARRPVAGCLCREGTYSRGCHPRPATTPIERLHERPILGRFGPGMSGPLIKIPFVKANACGNDFLIIEAALAPPDIADFSRRICDRHTGVGADGVEWLSPVAGADIQARL